MVKLDGARFYSERLDKIELSEVEAHNCAFELCNLRASSAPGQWHKIRQVRLVDAAQWNCSIDTAAFEDVELHNLKRLGNSPLFLWGCVFRHVKLSGRLSAIKINGSVGIGSSQSPLQPDWDRAVREFYSKVDWALDISEAKFPGGITFEAIPGNLIRRNPATQILVTRQRLNDTNWRAVDYDGSAMDIALSWFLDTSLFDSVVVAACSDPKRVKRDLAVIQRIRDAGIAESD